MPGALEALDAILQGVDGGTLTGPEAIEQLLTAQTQLRNNRRLQAAMRSSRLPVVKQLRDFDFTFQPSLRREQIESLHELGFVERRENVIFLGPPGVGKTHLAIALGMRAVELGFGVVFYRLEDLLTALKRDADLPTRRLRSKKYLSTSLVIIDEVGFEPMTRQEASLFFRLVSHRYQRGSILITTNKGIRDWPEVLAGDEILATAILDRLLHNSHVLDIKGRSYRLRDLERAVTQQGN